MPKVEPIKSLHEAEYWLHVTNNSYLVPIGLLEKLSLKHNVSTKADCLEILEATIRKQNDNHSL